MSTHVQDCGIARVPPLTEAEFIRFRGLVREQTGINLTDHKRHLLVARLARRLHDLGLTTFTDYYECVIGDRSGNELRTFINRITTNKTSFFREPHHFDFLCEHLIPELRAQGRRELRIWSAGCSSGEEPYSIGIALRETLGAHHGWNIRILASDIDTEMLAMAQSGTYEMELLQGLTMDRRRAHFLRGYGSFDGLAQVRPELRNMIEFRRINFNDPNWGIHARFDAIFCRNVIIYFDRGLQERIVERLASHLKPGGYFFSGHSENLHSVGGLLETVQPTVYRLIPGGKTQR